MFLKEQKDIYIHLEYEIIDLEAKAKNRFLRSKTIEMLLHALKKFILGNLPC